MLLGKVAAALIKQSNMATDTATFSSQNLQEGTIHFALSFLVLSECELYRRCFRARKIAYERVETTTILKTLLRANLNPDFEERRDAFSYYDFPISWPTLPSWNSLVSFNAIKQIFLFVGFHVALGCLSYPIKCLVNPGQAGNDFYIFCGLHVLFTSEDVRLVFLGFLLLRPLRWLNRMLFWSCIGWFEDRGAGASGSEHLKDTASNPQSSASLHNAEYGAS
jgi:hypothetical protein